MHEVMIIGAGPGGMAAAIQLKRYDITPVLLEQDCVGGLLRNANLVENYPGFPGGITGLELVELLERQLQYAGVDVTYETVLHVDVQNDIFLASTNKRVCASAIVVIATGTVPRTIPDLAIDHNASDRVYHEIVPVVDAENRRIAIIGGGDAAFDYALNLARKNEVTIINRSATVRCIPLLWNRSLQVDNITYMAEVTVKSIGDERGEVLIDCDGGDQIECDYVVIAVGRDPNVGMLSDELLERSNELIDVKKL